MPANEFGFSLGEVYRDIAAKKNADQAQEMNQLKIDEFKGQQSRNALVSDARNKALSGNEADVKRLLLLDPENGSKFVDALGKMDDRKRDEVKRVVDETGRMAFYVKQGKTPEERAQRYQYVRQNASAEMQKNMPPQYNEQQNELALMKATTMDKLLQNPTSVRVGNEDVVYQGGSEIARGTRTDAKSSGAREFKAGDENLVYKQMVELEGGLFDQNGNIKGLDSDSQQRAQARTALAMRLLKENPSLSLSEAVEQAANQTGLKLPNQAEMNASSDPKNPVNINNVFLRPTR